MLSEFKTLLSAAELPEMTFHQLRHAYASLAIGQGVGLEVIGEMLGHTDYSTTRNVYAHLTEELKRDAARAMSEAFRRRS